MCFSFCYPDLLPGKAPGPHWGTSDPTTPRLSYLLKISESALYERIHCKILGRLCVAKIAAVESGNVNGKMYKRCNNNIVSSEFRWIRTCDYI